jgi:predicted XRE-type DNA-binding protein
MSTNKTGRIGSSFDDFLREDGAYEETQTVALKRVLAWGLAEAMKAQGLTKKALAERMGTSRSQLDRLLDPAHTDVKLDTLVRAAKATGRELRLELVDVA